MLNEIDDYEHLGPWNIFVNKVLDYCYNKLRNQVRFFDIYTAE